MLGHEFLTEGTEAWLEALGEFRQGLACGVNAEKVVSLAELGQRCLLTVELIEQESRDTLDRLPIAWLN